MSSHGPVNAARVVRDVIVIGASAGGIQAVSRLLQLLPHDLSAIIAVTQHRSPFGQGQLARVLERSSGRAIIEPSSGDALVPDRVYLAPRDMHLLLVDGRAVTQRGAKEHYTRPAVDRLFSSAAESYGPRVVGVLLSGAGDDGVAGLMHIKAKGGVSLVQAPSEAEHAWMPTNALRFDRVDAALPLRLLASTLALLAAGEVVNHPGIVTADAVSAVPE
jgi:two-component system, chemotaxis family, protein-glutamate methylesterase/glutaminase